MRIERNVRLADEERSERPAGHSISYTQIASLCDLKLKFRRARVKVASPTGIALLYGRALHSGAEQYLRGAAKTPAQAIKAALRALDAEISKAEKGAGVRWDDWPEVNQDGSLSAANNNFGSLPSVEFARFWLERQLALWLLVYGTRVKVRFSEHRMFVPLTPPAPGAWKDQWHLEVWLDLIADLGDGSENGRFFYQGLDLKSTGAPWKDSDKQKAKGQAQLYMGATGREWGPPAADFEFHVLPRVKGALPALEMARTWALGDPQAEDPWPSLEEARTYVMTGGPIRTKVLTEGKGKAAVKSVVPVLDEKDQPVREWTLADALQVHEVAYDPKLINLYVKAIVRPKVSVIESGNFVADPSGWWCSEKFCDYFAHCAFGSGEHI